MKQISAIKWIAAFAVLMFVVSSCMDCIEGNGKSSVKNVDSQAVTALRLDLSADVFLVADSVKSITMEGDENILEAIKFENTKGRLKISSERCLDFDNPLRITIPVGMLNEVVLNGSGSIVSKVKIKAEDISLRLNGSGDIKMDLEARNIDTEVDGSGDMVLTGQAQGNRVEINGSGNVDCSQMPTSDVNFVISGSGDGKVMATKNLKVKVLGSGSVYYLGAPNVQTEIKGSGSVSKLQN